MAPLMLAHAGIARSHVARCDNHSMTLCQTSCCLQAYLPLLNDEMLHVFKGHNWVTQNKCSCAGGGGGGGGEGGINFT